MSLPTLILLLTVVGGGSFAAGTALPTASAPPRAATTVAVEPSPQEEMEPEPDPLPPGHPPIDDPASQSLPPGHVPVDDRAPHPVAGASDVGVTPAAEEGALDWKAPMRWQLMPNANAMRLATYRVPRAAGDAADAELSIARAGGSADANAERWIGQFDPEGQKTAKRTTRVVGATRIAIVEVQGTYSGGMGNDGAAQVGWGLVGAIVSTPGTPYFFKVTGPEKSVRAARGEFDALIGSLVPHRNRGI